MSMGAPEGLLFMECFLDLFIPLHILLLKKDILSAENCSEVIGLQVPFFVFLIL